MTEPRPVRLLTWDTIDKRCLILESMPGEKVCASIRWVPWNKMLIDGRPADAYFKSKEEQDNA